MSQITDQIRAELLRGQRPYALVKQGFDRSSVYKVYNLMQAGGELDHVVATSSISDVQDDEADKEDKSPKGEAPVSRGSGAETIQSLPGDIDLPAAAVNRVRNVLGISLVPKVLRMPMPELLYQSMVIAVSEMGWPALQPQDFIDTVLYQWLEACDYLPRAFIKKSELQKMVDDYTTFNENSPAFKKYLADHNLVTMEQARIVLKVPENGGNGGNGHTDAEKKEEPAPTTTWEKTGKELVDAPPLGSTPSSAPAPTAATKQPDPVVEVPKLPISHITELGMKMKAVKLPGETPATKLAEKAVELERKTEKVEEIAHDLSHLDPALGKQTVGELLNMLSGLTTKEEPHDSPAGHTEPTGAQDRTQGSGPAGESQDINRERAGGTGDTGSQKI